MKIQRRSGGFTLVELVVTVAIIALLATLALPSYEKAMDRARSIQCGQNLRQIGVAIMAATQDNDNKYPKINDAMTVYYPDDPDAKTLAQVLAQYGVQGVVLRCPSDVRNQNRYAQLGISYMWQPYADEESADTNSVNIYGRMRAGQQIFQAPSARVRIVTDYDAIHYNRFNTLYADGHVSVRYQ